MGGIKNNAGQGLNIVLANGSFIKNNYTGFQFFEIGKHLTIYASINICK